jgi:D-xylose transport system permease protein
MKNSSADWRLLRSVVALVAVMLILGLLTEGNFLSARNLTNLSRQVAINGILAIGMTYVILIGGIDLSVGSVVALAGVVAGLLQVSGGLAAWEGSQAFSGAGLSVLAALAVGLTCGVFNGFLITRYRIAPFIITLGMMVIARGLALILSNGAAVAPLSDAFNWIGQAYVAPSLSVGLIALVGGAAVIARLRASGRTAVDWAMAAMAALLSLGAAFAFLGYQGLPIPVLIFGALGLAGTLVLQRTRLGRFTLAIGGNPDAAWLAGVPIRKITFGIYAALGALAGLSGAILAGRLNGAMPTSGELFELDAIAAVVIGGTSLRGGVGTISGSILGAFLIGALNNGMSLLDITEFYQKVIKGVIIILAVWWDTRERKAPVAQMAAGPSATPQTAATT